MTAQQLKNSILQMAVQGKLVPQDPSDEPASFLLDRIRAKKEEMVKEGKIKKEKNPSTIFRGDDGLFYEKVGDQDPVCIEDELPFDIPESWEWVRLDTICAILNGDRGKNYPAKSTLSPSGIPFISAINLDGKGVVNDENLLCMSEEQYNKLRSGKLVKNDIIICIRGSLGKHGCFFFEKGAIASSLVIARPYISDNILSSFIMIFLDSPLFFSEIKRFDNGTAQPNLAASSLEQFVFPVPPLDEQTRIISTFHDIEPYIDQYKSFEAKSLRIDNEFPEQFKKSILQFAVQGKLVPQDPSDEPASALLERIRAEKEQLIKSGKIKRDNHESVIYRRDDSYYEKVDGVERCIDDEIPFDIPESWEWVRLGVIASIAGGKRIPAGRRLTSSDTGHIYLRVSDMKDHSIRAEGHMYIPNDIYDSISKYIIKKEDIYITVAGTIGYVGKIPLELDGANLTENADRIILWEINQDWLIQYLCSPFVQNLIQEATTKVGQPKLAIKRIENILIALPPLAEQERIVEKINQLFTFCNSMS